MHIAPIFKGVLPVLLLLTWAAPTQAQTYNPYQHYPPSYYYYPNSQPYGYSGNSNYNYGYQQHRYAPAPAATPAPTPKPARKAKPATEPKKKTKSESADISNWMTNWNSAWSKAQRLGRPLVTVFVHHGCPECDKMDATLSQYAAQETLKNAVKARVEFSNSGELVHKYGIKFTPTFLVFSPSHGGEVYREVGALSLERLRMLQPSIDALVTSDRSTAKESDDSDKDDKAASAGDSDKPAQVASL